MKLNRLIAIPVIALTAALGVAACSSAKAPALGLGHAPTAATTAPAATKTAHSANPPIQAAALPTVPTNSAIDGAQAVEPSTIDLSADGNGDLNGLTWSSWTAHSAKGSGSFNVNNCKPNCAQGTTVDVTVSVALSAPTSGSSPYFTAMTLTDSSGDTNTYAAGSNGSLNVISDALYIADEAPAGVAGTGRADQLRRGRVRRGRHELPVRAERRGRFTQAAWTTPTAQSRDCLTASGGCTCTRRRFHCCNWPYASRGLVAP